MIKSCKSGALLDSIEVFSAALHAVRTREQFMEIVSRYGLSRTHPQIWTHFHWFVDYLRRTSPVEAGIYDMNRVGCKYSNEPYDIVIRQYYG